MRARFAPIPLAAASLAACDEAPVNSGPYVEVRVVNSTGLSNVVVTVSGAGDPAAFEATWTFFNPTDPPQVTGTDIQTAGEPVQFHVEVGEEITDHTCHVHANAIGDEDNVPTAVIYSEPLRVVCQSGWQEKEAELSRSRGGYRFELYGLTDEEVRLFGEWNRRHRARRGPSG